MPPPARLTLVATAAAVALGGVLRAQRAWQATFHLATAGMLYLMPRSYSMGMPACSLTTGYNSAGILSGYLSLGFYLGAALTPFTSLTPCTGCASCHLPPTSLMLTI